MAEDNSGLLIAALVAIVSVVALVMLLKGGAAGGVVYLSGDAHTSFGRPYASGSLGVYGLDENRVCWQEGGQIVCHQSDVASPIAGRNV